MNEEGGKREAVRQWSRDPAGAWATDEPAGTAAFFDEIEATRYRSDPWLLDLFGWIAHGRVLEIGVGLGTDLERIHRLGATVVGLDLTPECVELSRRRFALRELEGIFVEGDAESLPFEDESFDGVYSMGVLHHTPNTARAVAEIHRVLRPGGRALVALYHRDSWFLRVNIQLIERLLHGARRYETLEERLSRVEFRSDDNTAQPLVKVYSRLQMRRMFTDFGLVHVRVDHLRRDELPRNIGRRLTDAQIHGLARMAGWYVIAYVVK